MAETPDLPVYCFFDYDSPLSPLAFSDFTIEKKMYHSVVHFYEYERAMASRQPSLAVRILNAQTPGLARRYAKYINLRDEEWYDAMETMKVGMLAKFRQSPKKRNYLLKTEGRRLAFCDPQDAYWGNGLHHSHPVAHMPEYWEGFSRLYEVIKRMISF